MRGSVRFLTIGCALAVFASSITYALKPSAAPPPSKPAPTPLPESASSKVSTSSIKQVRPLSAPQKLNLLKSPTGPIPAEQNLDAPIRLDARTPYVDPNHYLSAYDCGFNPFFEPPEILVRGGPSAATVYFRAEPGRTYLVDCSMDPGSSSQFTTRVSGKVTMTGAAVPGPSATISPPPDRHLTFVVRKDAAARDMSVEIHGNGSQWYLGTCEITPVRGL